MVSMRLFQLVFAFLALFTSVQGHAREPKQKLAICAIFQDEAPYLKEWIEFHLLVGVEHFYLYNNDSQDSFRKVLTPYVNQGIVTLIEWPSKEKGGNWLPDQRAAYNHCIARCVNKTQWLALIDVDEFMVPVDKETVTAYLAEFKQQPAVGAVKMNWQLFGTSGVPTLPSDRLLIETLTLKAPWNYASKDIPNNTIFKSIVRPEAVQLFRIHEGDYKPPFYAYPKGGQGRMQPVQIDRIQLNHYWTRAEDFFHEVKINRRLRFLPADYKPKMLQKLAELNAVEDTLILKYAERLRRRMQR
jgi:hypothetical protein